VSAAGRLPRLGFGGASIGNLHRPITESQAHEAILGGPCNSGVLASGSKSSALFNYAHPSEATLSQVRAMQALCRDFGVALPAAAPLPRNASCEA
jgi:hypothetical protein